MRSRSGATEGNFALMERLPGTLGMRQKEKERHKDGDKRYRLCH